MPWQLRVVVIIICFALIIWLSYAQGVTNRDRRKEEIEREARKLLKDRRRKEKEDGT